MKELTISQIARSPANFKAELEKGDVRIVWKEPKPNGKVVFSAVAKNEGFKNDTNSTDKSSQSN